MSGYIAYVLPETERERLLAMFPAHYPDVIAHHVTHRFPARPEDVLPLETRGKIAGFADDEIGIQAAVVEIGGTALRRDGEIYHITWSLDRSRGYAPRMSKKLIAQHGFRLLDAFVPITFQAEFLPTQG
jgi:hypothetical protein